MAKETKAQRVERIKKEKDGLDVLNDIYRYAQTREEVDPEDIDRFKWYGLYTQNRNLQDKDDSTQYFMLRIKLPGGRLDVKQLEAVAEISKSYARSTADFTTRQDIQLHFIALKDVPTIFARLNEVNLSTVFASGDAPRNVVTCPVNGIDRQQIYDVNAIAEDINRYFDGNKELSNLPRKYKVGISGCSRHCISHEIQDLSFKAVKMQNGEVLFDVCAGGGLASNKRIASHIGYVTSREVLPVVRAVTEIYKEYGSRENRGKARLGHLIDSWGVEKFIETVHKKIDFTLQNKESDNCSSYEKGEHFGVHKSIEEGKSYIGCAIDGGRIGADGLYKLFELLQKNGATCIKATATQNFLITDVPSENIDAVIKSLKEIDVDVNPSTFKAKTLSCTGINFCKYAVSETKGLAAKLVAHLQNRFPDFNEKISFSVNGCPHSCAHPHIVDIGLLGCKVKRDAETVPGFELILGGRLEGDKSSFGKKTGIKFIPEDACRIVENIIESYLNSHYKNFHDYAVGKIDV